MNDLPRLFRHLAVSGCLVTDALLPPPRSTSSDAVARVQLVRRSPCSLLVMLTFVGLLALCPQAFADSATITVTNTAGESDPAAELPRVFTLSGTVSVPEYAYVKYRGPGGAPCAPNAHEDSGSILWVFPGEKIEGSFSVKTVMTWKQLGTFMFCIWLSPENNEYGEREIVTPITQVITFRSPRGTISATVNPLIPAPGQQATVTVTGSSEAPEKVFAKIRTAGGAPCAPTYEADTGSDLIEGQNVNGSFSEQATTTQSKAGTYLICLWLASSGSDTSPIAGPQPETFTVASPPPPPPPPPPCIVPSFSSRMHLSTVEQRIRTAHCAVGRVIYVRSRHVRKGMVVHLGSAPGTHLASDARITIVVSSGNPRRHRHRRR